MASRKRGRTGWRWVALGMFAVGMALYGGKRMSRPRSAAGRPWPVGVPVEEPARESVREPEPVDRQPRSRPKDPAKSPVKATVQTTAPSAAATPKPAR